jgi:hypothetical protein
MSTDYFLHCSTCKQTSQCVASGSIAYDNKLWRAPEHLDHLSNFLFAHVNHDLRFVSEHTLIDMDEEDDT